jgi:hypothetical protein
VVHLRRRLGELLGSDHPRAEGYPRLDIAIFAVVVAGAIVLVGADFYMRHLTKSIAELTDIDGQKNFTTWFHSSILLGASLSALLMLPLVAGRRRLQWGVLGAGLAFFSLDKSISLHEQVGRGIANTFSLSDSAGRVAWEAAWSPIILATAIALILCVWEANRTTKLWACGMLAGGAIKLGMEAVMFPALQYLGLSEHGVLYGFEVEMEESIQLLGFGCIFAGLAQFTADAFAAALRGESIAPASEPEAEAPRLLPFRRAH